METLTLSTLETRLNVSLDAVVDNIRSASRRDLPWLQEATAHDGVALICGGGPSLRDSIEEIRTRQRSGQTIFAINGACAMLNKHGIRPDYLFMMDALPQSADFLDADADVYLLASQCHPDTFDRAAGTPTLLWHAKGTVDCEILIPPERMPDMFVVGGGVTALTRCMAIAFITGHRLLHCYGVDSSRRGVDHHAYDQVEDNGLHECIVPIEGREFKTSIAMAAQVLEFIRFSKLLADLDCITHIHGDGMLPFACQIAWPGEVKPMAMTEAC